MKTLLISLLFMLQSIVLIYAQTPPIGPNHVVLQTEIEDEATILTWESNREVNTDYFIIEKSIDSNEFETITTQRAGSSTYKKSTYRFEDVEENIGLTTYRITLVLMDGNTISYLPSDSNLKSLAEAIEK